VLGLYCDVERIVHPGDRAPVLCVHDSAGFPAGAVPVRRRTGTGVAQWCTGRRGGTGTPAGCGAAVLGSSGTAAELLDLSHALLANTTVVRREPHPVVAEAEPNDRARPQPISLPCTVDGRIDPPDDRDAFEFAAKKGQRFIIEAHTAEYGSHAVGPRVVDEHVRENMRKVLRAIQDGSFAREWVAEMDRGAPALAEARAKLAETEIEQVGKRLRALGREIREGLHYVLGHRVLRMVAGSTATSNFFSSMTTAVASVVPAPNTRPRLRGMPSTRK